MKLQGTAALGKELKYRAFVNALTKKQHGSFFNCAQLLFCFSMYFTLSIEFHTGISYSVSEILKQKCAQIKLCQNMKK